MMILRTLTLTLLLAVSAEAVPLSPGMIPGESIPEAVDEIYLRGLNYLADTQNEFGGWDDRYGSQPGVVGIIILSFLAHGEDPNYGPYSTHLKAAVDYLLASHNRTTGMYGTTMYNHAFATLALAEIYGTLDDDRLGSALQNAVDFILNVQRTNPTGAWRYTPKSNDADITVTGAQMIALLAARNAGIDVPDAAIQSGLGFIARCQSGDGSYNYTPSPMAQASPRGSIAILAMSLAKQRDSVSYAAAVTRMKRRDVWHGGGHVQYFLYYTSQALFHADMESWRAWYDITLTRLDASQSGDGSWNSNHGSAYGTAMSLLSLAVKYRFLPIYER